VQFAIFPVWLGAASVLGLPAPEVLYSRLASFLINLVTISAAAAGAYAIFHPRNSSASQPKRRLGPRASTI